MEQQRVRLGELLVGAKIITPDQLQEVLALQVHDGRKLGALLVASGYVTETQVTQILSQQLSVPWVSLHHIDFSRQLLNLVPRELAERHCLIPIYVRRSRHQKETLYIAMDDPTGVEARAEVELYTGLPVRPMIAPPSEILSAIRVYYGGEASLPPRRPMIARPASVSSTSPGDGEPESPLPARSPNSLDDVAPPVGVALGGGSGGTSSAAAVAPPPEVQAIAADDPGPVSSAPIQAREVSMPAPKAGEQSVKMVTLTLLDGTQLNLPAMPGRESTEEGGAGLLTARDLVAALRAHASGADASRVLGSDTNWQRVCAALLAVLLRKQLIADWEFVEELRR